MDLSIPILISLGALGYTLNTKKNETHLNNKMLGREKPSSKHTFNSNFVNEAKLKDLEVATLQHKKSRKPGITNVINSSVYPLDCSFDSETNRSGGICNDLFPEESEKLLNGPMFNKDLDYLYDHIPIENYDGPISNMSGLPMELTHNNMMPNTTIKGDYRVYDNVEARQTRLEEITGNTYKPEKNIKPFAQPHVDRSPYKQSFTQVVDKSRFDVSKFISNVVPFKQITVGKIPQQMIRIKEKNVDQLRSKVNPKQVHYGRTNHAKGHALPMNEIGKYDRKSRGVKDYKLGINNSMPTSAFYKKGYNTNEFTKFQEPKKTAVNEVNIGNPNKNTGSYFGISELWNAITGIKKDSVESNMSNNSIRNAKMNTFTQTHNENNLNHTYLKEQERDTTIINKYTGIAAKQDFGFSNHVRDPSQIKTTNKEMNLQSYFGISEAPNNAPLLYDNQKSITNMSEKPLFENYTPNGLMATLPEKSQIGMFKSIDTPMPEDYFGIAKKQNFGDKGLPTYGSIDLNNNKQMTDVSSRFTFMKPAPLNLKK
jgi:hypothetical protein